MIYCSSCHVVITTVFTGAVNTRTSLSLVQTGTITVMSTDRVRIQVRYETFLIHALAETVFREACKAVGPETKLNNRNFGMAVKLLL